MAAVAPSVLLDMRFDRGCFELVYDEALEPATVFALSSAMQKTRNLPSPVQVAVEQYSGTTQFHFGDNADRSHLLVPSLPITRCSFTVTAWVTLPEMRNHRIFFLSDWSYPWSYFFALSADGNGRVAVHGELRRDILSQGSDPNQGLVSVDSRNAQHRTSAADTFPFASEAVQRSVPVDGGCFPSGGAVVHVAWTWQREEGRLSAWVNGVCVASCVTEWDERDVQESRASHHEVGLKRDSGGECMKGGLLQMQVLKEAAVHPGAMAGLMRGVAGRMNLQRRRMLLQYRTALRGQAVAARKPAA